MAALLQRRQELLRNFMQEVWSNGDVDHCELYLAAEYTIHHDPGDPWDGQSLDIAGFQSRVTHSRAPFPDQQFHVLEMLSNERIVMVAWNWTATHTGNLSTFPATGRSISMTGATVYYFNDADTITGHWQVTDRLGIYQQLQRARRVDAI